MISISFKDIKSHLIPNPTACHDTLRKMLVTYNTYLSFNYIACDGENSNTRV
jgi:hypothetical protein